jgi:hypothetical protein
MPFAIGKGLPTYVLMYRSMNGLPLAHLFREPCKIPFTLMYRRVNGILHGLTAVFRLKRSFATGEVICATG